MKNDEIFTIRFIQDIVEDGQLIWKKSHCYTITYETPTLYYITSEVENETYGLSKASVSIYGIERTDNNYIAVLYPCWGECNVACNYCENVEKTNNGLQCKLRKVDHWEVLDDLKDDNG